MKIKKLSSTISVSGQLHSEDLAGLAAQGFRAIICNRPDGEGADQPPFAEMRAAAEKLGMQAAYLPVETGAVSDASAVEFVKFIEGLPKPVLAYCRSGARSATLWSMSQSATSQKARSH